MFSQPVKTESNQRPSSPPASSGSLRRALRSTKKWCRAYVTDRFYFPVWLLLQCLRHRQRAVILRRINALGDVVCTLPMAAEIRRRHPGRLFVFVTSMEYKTTVLLSRTTNTVYGARSWVFFPPTMFGLVEKIYAPQTTDERNPQAGTQCHLIDDLAGSCGIPLSNRQPRLYPTEQLIQQTLTRHGIVPDLSRKRKLIGINGGRSWLVKEWGFDQWQQLIDRIHTEYDATILLFGIGGDQNHYTRLRGIESFANHRMLADELVAVIAVCDLVISIDSGPLHIAGAVGTPVVGLFGANNPQYRLPPASPGIGLTADVPCLFCQHSTPRGHWQTGCPHDIRCMKELEVATVIQAVKTMLVKLDQPPVAS